MIEWRKDLEIGVDEIDNQHRELFSRFNNLLVACTKGKGKEEVQRLLLFLSDYVQEHFAAEEKLQVEAAFPGYQEHREQHVNFVAELNKLEKEFREEGATVSLVIQTNQTIVSWLIKHIGGFDKQFGAYLRSSR